MLKNRQDDANLRRLNMPILRDPLPLKNPPLLARRGRAVGGKMLVNIKKLTVDIDLIGDAGGRG